MGNKVEIGITIAIGLLIMVSFITPLFCDLWASAGIIILLALLPTALAIVVFMKPSNKDRKGL